MEVSVFGSTTAIPEEAVKFLLMQKTSMVNISNLLKRIFYFTSYLRKPPWDTGVSPPELLDFLQTHPSGRALDLGCGTGTNVITLALLGWEVTGVDFIPAALQSAREKIKQSRVPARVIFGDVTRLDNVTGLYDLVLDIGCYHSLNGPGKRKYEANIMRRLAPEGTLLLYGFFSTPERQAGIKDEDIRHLSKNLVVQRRQEGLDRQRKSVWFEFQKPSQ